jgi:hypothetical protein
MRFHFPAAIAFALCIICLLPTILLAEGVGVEFGLQAGLNLAKATYDPPADFFQPITLDNDFRTVFGGGGTVSLTFPDLDVFTLESGLLIQMKGGETRMTVQAYDWITQEAFESKWNIIWKYLYLSIPICVRLSIPAGSVKPYLKAGAEIDILLSAEWKQKSTHPDGTITVVEDVKDDTAAFDAGLIAGAGVEASIGRARPFVELIYCHGVIDTIDPEETEFNVKAYNRVVGIIAGVRF